MTMHRALAATAAVLGLLAIAAGEPARGGGRVDLARLADDVAEERDHISAITLATWIRDARPGLHVIDLRDSVAFQQMHIPTAVRMSVGSVSSLDFPLDAPIVLYSEGGTHAAQAWFILRARGYRKVYFLREGLYEWVSRVMTPMLAEDATDAERAEYLQTSDLSRYFGGTPQRDVPRASIPDGYWLHDGESDRNHGAAANDVIENVRRRGC